MLKPLAAKVGDASRSVRHVMASHTRLLLVLAGARVVLLCHGKECPYLQHPDV